MTQLSELRAIIGRIYSGYAQHNGPFFAATIAYYALFSLFPLFLLLISLLGFLVDSPGINRRVFEILLTALPGSQAFVEQTLDSVRASRGSIGVVGLIGLLWSGTNVFLAIQHAFNIQLGVPGRGLIGARTRTVVVVILGGSALAASLLFSSFSSVIRSATPLLTALGLVGADAYAGVITRMWTIGVALALSVSLFAILYRYLPNAALSRRQILAGALLGGVLWEGAKYLFTWYLGIANYRAVYGSVGAAVALLLWAYVSSSILLLGLEVANVVNQRRKQ